MAHPATGLATRSMFLPVPAEVKAFADKVIEDHNAAQRYAQAQARRQNYLPRYRAPFRPFPRLWEAFADDPEVIAVLDNPPGGFAFLDDAGRTLAMRGKAAAREYIIPSPPNGMDAMADEMSGEVAADLPPRANSGEEAAESLDRAEPGT